MSLLGSIGKGLVGAVTGFVTGGPAGALVGAASTFAGGGAPKPAAPAPTLGGNIGYGVTTPFGGFTVGGGVAITKGVQGTLSYTPGANGGGCPKGYHLNKHALPASRTHGAAPARTICVRNRHLNALNGRAAMRALRRLKRADKQTRKIHAIFHRPARKAVGRKR